MIDSRKQYNAIYGASQISLLLLLILLAPSLSSAELSVISGPGQAGPLSWRSVEVRYRAASNEKAGWRAELAGLRIQLGQGADSEPGSEFLLDQLLIECPDPKRADFGPAHKPVPGCENGFVVWRTPENQSRQAGFSLTHQGADLVAILTMDGASLEGRWSFSERALGRVLVTLDAFELGGLRPLLAPWIDMDAFYGLLSGQLEIDAQRLTGQFALDSAGFDGNRGQLAGDGLTVDLAVSGEISENQQSIAVSLTQSAGELLVGPLYLPSPEQPIEVSIELVRSDALIRFDSISYVNPGVVELQASAVVSGQNSTWSLSDVHLTQLNADLQHAWPRWVDGLAASFGFSGMQASGEVSASARLSAGQLDALDLNLNGIELTDPKQRLTLAPTSGRIFTAEGGLNLALELEGIALYGLPIGPTQVRASENAGDWRLTEPLRMPLLDGAVVLDRLALNPDSEAIDDGPDLTLDARIETLSLEQLTTTLGWPQFGGNLAGNFPGIEFRDDRLDFTGGININAFSGQIQLTELSVERPFGTLPALAAQVEINRLDLLELTGAFNFGRMEGEVSGWMRDLRLLDWQPVAMDTRLYTHDDAPKRRISQRAVDNLSNLGGSFGGALISGTVLSVFEDFPYRRAGLACRLSNNICYIDGVAKHDSGGFYIVEGRGLPHLDIIGHRRLVDWPQLLSQLEAATR